MTGRPIGFVVSSPFKVIRLLPALALTALALLALPGSAAASGCDLYAAPGGSDSASGTDADPLASAQALVDALAPGQTGCLREGTYEQTWQVKISTPDITLTSAPGERALLRTRLWVAQGADGVTVSGLELDGTNDRILPSPTINGDDVTFRDNDVTNHHTAICFLLGSSDGWGVAHRTLIESNKIHDCGVLPSANHDHGIYVSVSRDAVIRDNWIYDNADRGVQLYKDAQRTTIVHNVIDGNGEGVIFGGDDTTASSDNVVEGNVITNSNVRYNVESHWVGPVGTGNVARNNCVQGGVRDSGDGAIKLSNGGFEAIGNLIVDPMYADRAGKDFTLKAGSPCADVLGPIDEPAPDPTSGGGGSTDTSGTNTTDTSGTTTDTSGTNTTDTSGTTTDTSGTTTTDTSGDQVQVHGKRKGHYKVRLRGLAPGADRVTILQKRGKRWKKIHRQQVRRGSRFSAKVKVRGKRRRAKLKVSARGLRDSTPLKVRVR